MNKASESKDYRSLMLNSLLEIREMRYKLNALEHSRTEPIAIIGMSCRFPGGSDNLDAFWQLLHNGVDAITEVPSNRWNIDAYYDPDQNASGKMYSRYGGFINQLHEFNPQFFGISPREAVTLDPQQRLLLEVTWEALENSGLVAERLVGSQTGVFIGISNDDYLQLSLAREPDKIDAYLGTGNAHSLASGRLSYFLGLRGPSLSVDTACSSSLVTVHLACQSLRNRECDLALTGGVNRIISPKVSINFSKARMLTPDGRCKTFDARADGYVRGEGCGMLVLKRLSNAIADGDPILALIRGSAVNQDGRSSGLTVPSGPSQQVVIRKALENAGVEPAQVSYVEAHGTGTSLGDPIEVGALGAVFGKGRPKTHPLVIGSVKTNVGHLEAAAGVVSLIKVVLALQHKEIPPNLHFKQPNPYISWNDFNLIVPTERIPWTSGEGQRIAGVSAFSFSGTNAHIVLEESPATEPVQAQEERPLHLLALSAKAEEVLKQLASRYENYLTANPTLAIGDVCFTANTGRSHFNHRLSVVASSSAQLCQKLAAFTSGQEITEVLQGHVHDTIQPKVAFIFTGQGSQYLGMGRQLYEDHPTFRQALDRCNTLLCPYLKQPLLEVLYPESEANSPLDNTTYTQPALFALEYALVETWKSWGIKPSVVMGHSLGEYVAACVAGVFSLEDGLKLVAERARLMQTLPETGEMVAVFASEARVGAAIQSYACDVSIAAINGPENIVVSGMHQAVRAVIAVLEAEGVKTKKLKVFHAFHSPLMEPILKDFERVAREVTYSPPQISLVSNVTGQLATTEIATPEYWLSHLLQPVKFAASIKSLVQEGYEVFVEMGPQPTLVGMGRNCLTEEVGVWLPSLRQGQSDWQQMLQSLGELYIRGMSVNWSGFDKDYLRRRILLPTYPFQGQNYWFETTKPDVYKESDSLESRQTTLHPLLNKKVQSPLLKETLFESYFSTASLPLLKDHQIHGAVIVPGAFYISMLLGAIEITFGAGRCLLENVLFSHAFVIPEGEMCTVQLVITPEDGTEASFKLISLGKNATQESSSWTVHATGSILTSQGEAVATNTLEPNFIKEVQARCTEEISNIEFYQAMWRRQIQLGASFQVIGSAWKTDREVLCQLKLPQILDINSYQLHPAIIDSCLQALSVTIPAETEGTFIPFNLEKFCFFHRPSSSQLWCYASLQEVENSREGQMVANVQLFEDSGQVIAVLEGLRYGKANRDILLRSLQQDLGDWLYEIAWQPKAHEQNYPSVIPNELGSWIIFADQGGIGLELASLLEEQGNSCILVFPDQAYRITESQHYHINPAEPLDFQRLLQESLGNNHPPCRGVVHLWSLEGTQGQETTLTSLHNTQALGCGSVLHLVKSLVQEEISELPRLWLVTRSAQMVEAVPAPLEVAQAPLWGLGRVIALEHPDLHCVRLDLERSSEANEIQALFAELRSTDQEDQVAYRQGARYVARLVQHTSPNIAKVVASQPEVDSTKRKPVHPNSSYLITGGLGALGLKVAHWMVEQGAKHLALTGRSDASSEAQEVISQMEQKGCQVLVVKADVSNQEDTIKVLTEINAFMPPLQGIIHTAGVLDDGVLLQQNWESFCRVMAPKVAGSWNLHTLTQDLRLDFFVCFSSIVSLLGSPGQGNYAAANAFMDALVHHRRTQGLPGLSINWGPWAELGMAASLGNRDQNRLTAQGLGIIAIEKGLQILGDMLRQGSTQVAVLPIKWSKFLQQFPLGGEMPLLYELASQMRQQVKGKQLPVKKNELLHQLREATEGVRQKLLITYVQDEVAKVLGISSSQQLNSKQQLNDLGLDSLMLLDLRNRFNAGIEVNLPPTKLLQYPNIVELAEELAQQLAVKSLSSPETSSQRLITRSSEKSITNWVINSNPRPDPRLRLFCFHHLGGNASMFSTWSGKLPLDIEVCSVQLPGRENLIDEQPFTQFALLVETLVQELIPHLDKPFAFYGHSMGTLISFEVAHLLKQMYGLSPFHLFVSGLWAPHTHASALKGNFLSEEQLLDISEIPQTLREDKNFMDVLMSVFKADSQLFESYTYSNKDPLVCPISAFGGTEDTVVNQDGLSQWLRHTRSTFKIQMLPGKHMFPKSSQKLLLEAISQDLIQSLSKLALEQHQE